MIADRVDAGDGAPDAEGLRIRERFDAWLEDGQELVAQARRLAEDLERSRTLTDGAQQECARLRDAVSALRGENDALRGDNAQLADEITALRGETARLEAEAARLREQNAALMSERGETAKLIADKLEDMLVQVLPRLTRPGVAPGEARPTGAPVVAPPRAAAPASPVEAELADHVAELSDDAAELIAEPEAFATAGGDGSGRVLIVDDESDVAEVLVDYLATSGHEALVAESGEAALAALDDFQPQAVLLDIMMAGIGGMETLRRIKARCPDMPVIMITALDDRDVARRACAAGAADYLTKPLSLDLLDAALAVHVHGALPASPPPDELVEVAEAPHAQQRPFFGRG